MNILLINTFYYPEIKGGTEYSVKKLAEGLLKRGFNVAVMVSANENKMENVDGVKVYRVKFNSIFHSYGEVKKNLLKKIVHRILDFCNPFNKSQFDSVFCDFKPDVIHTNNLYEITPFVWLNAHGRKIPVLHTVRDYYFLCYKTNLMKTNGLVCTEPNVLCKFYRYLYRVQTKNVDYITAPSKQMLKNMTQDKMFKYAQKSVVYNAMDYDMSIVNKNISEHISMAENRNEIRFIFLGGFHPHKGIRYLIDSFENISNDNARLVFAGKGEELDFILDSAKKDYRISYLGMLNEEELNECLASCNVLVCPSLWEEPFGRVVLDAYKNGLIVIGNRIGALPEIIDDGKTGFLLTPGNGDELQNIIKTISDNPRMLVHMLPNITEYIKQFDINNQLNEFTKIYNYISNSSRAI